MTDEEHKAYARAVGALEWQLKEQERAHDKWMTITWIVIVLVICLWVAT